MSDTITAEQALAVVAQHLVPEGQLVEELRAENVRLRALLSDRNRTISQLNYSIKHVNAVLDGEPPYPYEAGHLARRVYEAINKDKRHYEKLSWDVTREARMLGNARRAHEAATASLQHEITSMVQLYNKAAGPILFDTEGDPDFMELHDVVERAIKAAAKDRNDGPT